MENNIYEIELSAYPAEFAEDNLIREELMVEVEDGVRLETVIIRPDTVRKIPLIYTRSPYAMAKQAYDQEGAALATRGIAFSYQFCRGTGNSEGIWEPNIYDRNDGKAYSDYLASLEWISDMGYYGASYVAFTGWIMADIVPEKVKGMYLGVYGTDRHVSAYKDGLFRQDILTSWTMGNAGRKIDADYMRSCAYRPQVNVDRDFWGTDLSWYRDWITHTDYTDPYWKTGVWKTLREIPARLRIPVVIEEGWYDHHLGGAMVGYRELNEQVKSRSLLRIGCWNHSKQTVLEDRETVNAENEQLLHAFEFFRSIFKTEEAHATGVQVYEIGGGTWLSLPAWPEQTGYADYYLNTSEVSGFSDHAKLLSKYLPGTENNITYTYDPENPVMSHGTESCFKLMQEVGSLRQPEPGFRQDVISFISEPLEDDMLILGQINADLYVSSDAEDTSFTMKVSEINEEGRSYNIRSGITTLAYRGHSDVRQSYTPGETVRINIDSWDICWKVHKGCRIRVDISSSDFPEYSVHSNYPGVWALQAETKKAEQTIYTGGAYPSVLHIPVFSD